MGVNTKFLGFVQTVTQIDLTLVSGPEISILEGNNSMIPQFQVGTNDLRNHCKLKKQQKTNKQKNGWNCQAAKCVCTFDMCFSRGEIRMIHPTS